MSKLNYEHVFNTLVEETAKYITKNNLKAMVLGISGGIDSTVVAAICHEVSKKTGIPLIGRSLPIKNKSDEFDVSELVGQVFCDDFKVVNLLNMYQHVNQSVYDGEGTLGTPISKGNIQARLRMIYLYNLASIHRGLVMSTDNQTEPYRYVIFDDDTDMLDSQLPYFIQSDWLKWGLSDEDVEQAIHILNDTNTTAETHL